jgi:hypothetical protein
LARTYADTNGVHIELTSDELKNILSTSDMGEMLYELIGPDALAKKIITPEIVDIFIKYIFLNKNSLSNVKGNGVLLTLPPEGNWLSVIAKSL